MEFRILGPLEVRGERGALALGGAKPRAVLAVLLLHANESVSAERLAVALWGEDAPAGAVKTVQVHVSRLRKALGDADIVETTPAGYRLRVRRGELDAERFARSVEEGRRALEAGDPERAAVVLRDGLALWRGPALADLALEPFAPAATARLEEQRLVAFEARVEADMACGRHGAVVGELQELLADHPTREGFVRLAMLALYRSGRQAEALATYQRARRVLVEELGLEPGPELRGLQDAILRQDPSLDLPEPPSDLPPQLDLSTAPPLIGRGPALDALCEHWEHARRGAGRLVTVLGAAGMGKTRLAAELAAVAHRAGAGVTYAAASGAPDAVRAALRRGREASRPTLVVVDDVDRAGAEVQAELADLADRVTRLPVLVLASARDARTLAASGVHDALTLEPLDADAVRAIPALASASRAGRTIPEAWLLETSGGVPARVHELVGQWLRREAARRVATAAERTAAGRADLGSMETELTGGVLELREADERIRPAGDMDAPVVCPFKGLASFDLADAPYFFGRERLVAELVARMVGAPLLGVVGPSGSGKSSVVRAGLLPALAAGVLPGSESWPQIVIRPGEHPLRELRRATAGVRANGGAVVAVDQFEETFTACRDEDERAAFVRELVDGGGALRVAVLAVRADHYGRCAAYPELSRLLAAHHVLVGAMRRDELRRAVERPAQLVGLRVDPELTDTLLADVEHEPGSLPLLSTALLELWQHRDGRVLRLSTYERTGGVRGAVTRHAEEAFARLAPEQHAVARSTLLRLVTDDGVGGVERRRMPLSELDTEGNEAVAQVVALLTDQRLLTVSAGAVELAHEALLREWPRLRGWLEDDRVGRRLHRHLAESAREWDQRGRDPGDLYRGARLAAALEWRGTHEPELNKTEHAFLDAGFAAEQADLTAAHRRARRLRALAAGLAVLVLVSAASAILAARQTRRATLERSTAVSRSLAAQAVARLSDDFVLAALLGLESYRARPTFEARTATLSALSQVVRPSRVLGRHTHAVQGLAFNPRDGTLAAGHRDGTVSLWDVAARRPLGPPLDTPADWLRTVAFSPDGSTLAGAGADRTLHLWDARSRRSLGPPLGGSTGSVHSVAFSRDGRTVAAADDGGRVRLFDIRARREVHRLVIPEWHEDERWPYTVALSPDGGTLAIAGRVLRLYDGDSPRPVGSELSGHGDTVNTVAFSPDGRTLATGSDDETVRLWDVRTRRALGQPLTGHTDWVLTVAFSPDGRTLASAGNDRTVRLWDVHARRALGQPLAGHTSEIYSVAFGPDGRTLASGSDDRTIRLWDPMLWSDDRQALERRICGIVQRSLTRAEWAEFVPDEPYRETCPRSP